MPDKEKVPEPVQRVLHDFGDCKDFHDRLVEKLDKSEQAFQAILNRRDDAAQWGPDLHPPWVNHIVETAVASLIDDKLTYSVTPAARFYNPGEYESARGGAEAHEILMRQQLNQDHFTEIQRPFSLQALIAPLTVAKTYWKRELVSRKRMVVEQRLITDPLTGMPTGFVPELKEAERVEPLYEGATTEVVNFRDFLWHEAATSSDKCRFFIHRVWYTRADLEKLGRDGFFQNVDQVLSPKGNQDDPDPNLRIPDDRNRVRDLIEVLEHWDMETGKVTWVGQQKVLLRERKFPFWHMGHPFTIASVQPYPFRLDSKSMVEKLEHLQMALWDLQNQRHLNVQLLNNAVWTVDEMTVDIEGFEIAPGAVNTGRPEGVVQWQPNPLPAEISIGAESMLKSDMQNLSGSQPFTSTSEARNVGANTATEAALVSSIGQAAIKQMKIQLNNAYGRIGQMRLELNKQFLRKPIYAEKIGLDETAEVIEILPEMLQGDYRFDITPMNESLMRQERRAERANLFQLVLTALAPFAAVGIPINPKPALDDLLDAFDVENKERWYSMFPQTPPPGPGGQQGTPGQPPLGVTGPNSIAPEVSPSNQMSISPERMMQRNLAMTGGVQNV